jgi:hypothetical protein
LRLGLQLDGRDRIREAIVASITSKTNG